jgi:hypothetical protein
MNRGNSNQSGNCKKESDLLVNGLYDSCVKANSESFDCEELKLSEKELEIAKKELDNSPIVEVRKGFPSNAYHDRKEYKERKS